jgi:hypothetical protein
MRILCNCVGVMRNFFFLAGMQDKRKKALRPEPRMRQEIPLSDAELAAFNDGATSLESLLSRLANVPTPAGQTPSQLRGESPVRSIGAQAGD